MKILVFGGTTEGRECAAENVKAGHEVTVSVATEMGAEELRDLSVNVMTGRLDAVQMTEVMRGFDIIIDATHPYATEVSKNIQKACADTGLLYQRIERNTSFDGRMPDACVYVADHKSAAEYLTATTGNVLLTTGSKNIRDYDVLPRERVYVRTLPTMEAISACEGCGILNSHIIAMHGPFSSELNEAMIRQYDIQHLVTKKTGAVGGFPEKVRACLDTGIEIVVVLETGDGLETGDSPLSP